LVITVGVSATIVPIITREAKGQMREIERIGSDRHELSSVEIYFGSEAANRANTNLRFRREDRPLSPSMAREIR
jgi:hypothetical protein